MKKRAAIVSSYHEECGAAYYSSRLIKHLTAEGFDVEIKRLPVSLLRTLAPYRLRAMADVEIKRIANEIKSFDVVFLQFEPGLYGSMPKFSYSRVLRLLKAAKNVVVTIHGFDREMHGRSFTGVMRQALRGNLISAYAEAMEGGVNPIIDSFWEYVRRSPHVKVMTFNRGDQILLQRYFDLKRIDNFPITYFAQDEVEQIRATTDRERFLRHYGLDPSKKYFAVYGFLSWYKGHLAAMKALEYLPEDWHLAIVGGEHPQALEADRDIGGYVRQILAFQIEKGRVPVEAGTSFLTNEKSSLTNAPQILAPVDYLNRQEIKGDFFKFSEFKHFFPSADIRNRIHYLGQVSDEDMPRFYAALDYPVHPYIKTKSGQSGSGPATFALEFRTRALFSNAPVFREMNLYFENAMHFFNVGNFIELAESLQRFDNFEGGLATSLDQALDKYNPKTMVAKYRDLIDA